MTVLREIALGLAESIRETLPSTETEAGPFLAGMAWAFLIFWAVLIFVTLQHCASRGGC